jgi:DNA gyrase/topoisomerase IV subunit A
LPKKAGREYFIFFEGLFIALDNLDEVIKLIRLSNT